MRLLKAIKSKLKFKTKVKPKTVKKVKTKPIPKSKLKPKYNSKAIGKKVPMTQKFKDGFKALVKKALKKKGIKVR